MVEYIDTDQQALDRAFYALADETRRAILQSLRDGELRVTELAAPFDVSLNAISKHIKALECAGFVSRRRQGRDHFLSVNPAAIEQTANWIERERTFWNARLDSLEQLMNEEAGDE